MKKNNFTFFVILLFGLSLFVSGSVPGNIDGYGKARWGDSKAKTKKRLALKPADIAKITERNNFIIVDYKDPESSQKQKKYEFSSSRLVRLHILYNKTPKRVLNTLTNDYGAHSRLENGVYYWTFPSTVIKHEGGAQKAVFRDSSFGTTGKHQDIDKVKVGMTTDAVRELMGTPVSTATASGGITYYRYSTGTVTFKLSRVAGVTKGGEVEKKEPKEKENKGNIDRVKAGMTIAQVEAIMGKPTMSIPFGNLLIYNYSTGSISFKNRKVAGIRKIK
ncbi:MAG: outer membrane protein assembly factor BamE [Candidatus Aminicenantes bacterium]|nr:outer membrane protein assembly factor BamE [Candidatus Aminicenantes bacterium]